MGPHLGQPQRPRPSPARHRRARRPGHHVGVLDRLDPDQPGRRPAPGRFLAAKATVLTAVSLITGEATALTAFLLGQALISGQAPTAAFGQPGVLRAVLGAGLYLAALGLLGVALGTLLRHPAAAIGVLVAVALVLPGIAAALPARIESNVEEYWPTMAGAQVTAVIHGTHQLGPWPGFGLMCLFIAAAMAAAFLLLARRDT